MYGVGFGYGAIGATTKRSGGSATDADAASFFTAAGITDATQKNAVNQLVLDLKSNNLWTKMKALYPVVGGNATAHSYNLKNTSQFQLSFSSGWIHSSTGMVGNGTSAYADTLFNPSVNSIDNSSHLSYYSRTLVTESKIEMGSYEGTNFNQLAISFGGTSYFNPNNGSGSIQVNFATNSKGFFIASRTSSTNVFGQQNTSQTSGIALTAKNNINTWLGAINNSTPYYSTKECALASIGDGLSTSEALAFNTIVQTFQTSLSRNV